MISPAARVIASVSAGIAAVILPMALSFRPAGLMASGITLEAGILATSGVYWVVTRSPGRAPAAVSDGPNNASP